jgi:hypothetical protein
VSAGKLMPFMGTIKWNQKLLNTILTVRQGNIQNKLCIIAEVID